MGNYLQFIEILTKTRYGTVLGTIRLDIEENIRTAVGDTGHASPDNCCIVTHKPGSSFRTSNICPVMAVRNQRTSVVD